MTNPGDTKQPCTRTASRARLFLFLCGALAVAFAAPPARTIPEKVILGYSDGACDAAITDVARDGVNVLMWSFINLNGANRTVQAGVDLACVARVAKQLTGMGLETLHIVSIGGWDAPHPDTASGDGAAWFAAWDAWNRNVAANADGFANGFDGFDWDLEGNDAPASPYNTFSAAALALVGDMSVAAKAAGYLVTMAPPQSYLDVSTGDFDLSLTHNDPTYHADFRYFGHNVSQTKPTVRLPPPTRTTHRSPPPPPPPLRRCMRT